MEGLGEAGRRHDVEMQNILADSEFCIQRHCGRVFAVCLDKDRIGSPCGGHLPEFGNECRGHTLSPMLLVYRQIVDVDLGPDLLEFRKDIGGNASDDPSVGDRGKTDEGAACEQPFEVIVAGLPRRVSFHLSKRSTEHGEHVAKRPGTSGTQDSDVEGCMHCDGAVLTAALVVARTT